MKPVSDVIGIIVLSINTGANKLMLTKTELEMLRGLSAEELAEVEANVLGEISKMVGGYEASERTGDGEGRMKPEYSFPCNPDKTPRQKEWQRGVVQYMSWKRAELVAAPTGERNGFDVLDIDPKGAGWYDANFDALPTTRAHQTRRDGVHLLFRHAPGLRGSVEKIALGVDVRAEGGYAIWWPREGFAVEDHPLTEWPDWLLAEAMAACRKSEVTGRLNAIPRQKRSGDGVRVHDAREVANLTEALRAMDPRDWNGTWDEWFAVLGASKAQGISGEDFAEWSMRDPEYADHREKIERIWNAARGEHGGALFAALAERGIKVAHINPNSFVSRDHHKSASHPHPQSASPKFGHPLDRIEGLRQSLRRDQREPSVFWHSRLYAEILFEQRTTSPKAFEVAQSLLESDCRELIKAIGIDAVRRSILRGFDKASVAGKNLGEENNGLH
jgi:Bifunctional DNA primase/polymerase, N-terminal/Primase C terminal 2 (PriCT-2)